MKSRSAWLFAAVFSIVPAAWAADGQQSAQDVTVKAAKEPAAPATYDVFIDGVTGYAFVRTPYGWKFVRSLRDEAAPGAKVAQR